MDWLNYQPVCTQCSSYEGSTVLIATTAVSSSVNHVLCIPKHGMKKTRMLNITVRKETKFLVSIQLTKGGNHNFKNTGYFQNPIISFSCSREGWVCSWILQFANLSCLVRLSERDTSVVLKGSAFRLRQDLS